MIWVTIAQESEFSPASEPLKIQRITRERWEKSLPE
jgi:hypothetical protein